MSDYFSTKQIKQLCMTSLVLVSSYDGGYEKTYTSRSGKLAGKRS